MSDETDCVVIGDELARVVIWPAKSGGPEPIPYRVDIFADTFRCTVDADVLGGFEKFHFGLVRLYETLTGEVGFPAIEGLEMNLRGDGRGHIHVSVRATADYSRPIDMRVGISIDQTQLPPIIAAVERVLIKGSS